MKRTYTAKEINYIKEEIRTGKPVSIIADNLCVEFDRPIGGVYAKVWKLAKSTKKIKKNYDGPTRRPHVRKIRPAIVQQSIDFDLMPGSLLDVTDNKSEVILKEICEEIVEKSEIKQEPAEIGIEVPPTNISFNGIPSRVVIYSDHVRYYYNN